MHCCVSDPRPWRARLGLAVAAGAGCPRCWEGLDAWLLLQLQPGDCRLLQALLLLLLLLLRRLLLLHRAHVARAGCGRVTRRLLLLAVRHCCCCCR
jgi:hypothetical protein